MCRMTAEEADAFKMLSKTTEAAEAPMPTDTRDGALKMVAEAPKTLETEAGYLNLMELEASSTMADKVLTEGGRVGLIVAYAVAGVEK